MLQTKGYAVQSAESKFETFDFGRREMGANDILIEIQFCGVCHSDIHQAKNEWGNSIFPMVPGHEIVGRVAQTGADVSKFETGDFAGVGCFVDSCGECENCETMSNNFVRCIVRKLIIRRKWIKKRRLTAVILSKSSLKKITR